MKLINVIYDYEYDYIEDVITDISAADILSVPDFVCDNLNDIVQEFFNWTNDEVRNAEKSMYPEYWTQLSNGKICMGINSDHFVKWLNNNYYHFENKESVVVKIETTYISDYPTAKF